MAYAVTYTIASRETLLQYFWTHLSRLCVRHACWPGEVLDIRRKSKALAAVRADLVAVLRHTVGYQETGTRLSRELRIFPGGRPPGWKPVSYLLLSRVLGLTHSTLVSRQQRCRQQRLRVHECNKCDG
jgi:hypothetical protein